MSQDLKPGYKKCLKVAHVYYEGKLKDGTVFDSNMTAEQPMPIMIGAHEVIPGFELALADMQVGERREIVVPPDQAYGYPEEQAIQRSRLSLIKNGDTLKEGMRFKMRTPVSMDPVEGKVLHINGDFVEIDFNHPLAGETLLFTIDLVGIDDSSDEV